MSTDASSETHTASPARRGRGRGRANGAQTGNRNVAEDGAQNTGERGKSRGARRGGRGGRGNRGGRDGQVNGLDGTTERVMNAPLPGQRQFGAKLTAGDAGAEGEAKVNQAPDGEEDVEAEVCFICASPVVHNSVAPCNHRTCHICSLRLRALYKSKACAHCRTPAEFVIFTDDAVRRYQDYAESDLASADVNLGIKYEKAEICDDTILLLRYNCPDAGCDIACMGWPDLHRHVKSVHHKVMCDLCTRNKKVFTHEHELFTVPELRRHEKYGDDNPGAVDQSGFKGHPECGFCRQRFYGDDELYAHCRDRHERCHICDRRNGGARPQYYLDYNQLEVHFRKDHFVCPDQECLEKKFVVFESEMDLKAHQLEAHPNGLTKDARRDARRVDISGFNYRAPHEQDRPRREGRGRGRGRDPNAEPLPQSSAQPMSRAELAYQRQMAIQSAQSVTTRTFGGNLTQPSPTEAFAARPPPRAQEPPTVTTSRPAVVDTFPALSTLSIGDRPPSPSRTLTPQEQARRLRHNAVSERASNMLANDAAKMTEFRTRVSQFNASSSSAPQLIDSLFTLFDGSPASELGKLVKELADLFEAPNKREALQKAWADWRAINEDYPTLPVATGSASSSSSINNFASALGGAAGGNRVLNLKKSTAQSARSPTSKSRSWGSAGPATSNGASKSSTPAANNSTAFPPLGRSAGASTASSSLASSTPWAGPSSSAASAASSARASPAPSRSQSSTTLARQAAGGAAAGKRPAVTTDAFPSLPAAPKPRSTVFSPGYSGRAVRNVASPGPGVSAWGGGGGGGGGGGSDGVTGSGAGSSGVDEEEVGGGRNGKKVQGKKKGFVKLQL